MFQTNVVQKIKPRILCWHSYFRKYCRLCDNVEKYSTAGGPQMTWRMRIACCIPNAKNAHSEYVMYITFPVQRRLHERVLMIRYTYIAFLV
jgi:hypothetical protein